MALPKRGGKTYEEIAKECGVHVNTIGNWRKDTLFERELKRQIVRNTQDRLPELMGAMIDNAIETGNAAAAKLILTANDMLTDRVEVNTSENGGHSIEDIKAKIAQYESKSTDGR
ncbi:hypothetical protein [Bacillus sp. JJ722]|uniref:hypothetical protein n=1 Tax=Bacillus sp. JJ722 TaxID=3122973 RepID=UPI003F68A3FE